MSGEQNNELLKEVENLRREIRKLKQQQTYSYFRFKYLSETLRLPELIHGQVIEFIKSGGEYIPNIEKPRSFIEKLQWLYKYYWRDNPRYAIEGKVAGKQYIVDMLGNKFAIDNIGIFTDPSQIQLERIPDKCVVKRDPGGGGEAF
ncbi:hypothetical protein FACS18949_11260 [Clostridia bacterium]|nr:hypothetical protein FACS18949_11260 [Clostridia bacterium]